MDPYLEGAHMWEDFHASLAREIRDQLAPQLRPRYFAALTPRVTYEEVVIEEKHVARPDVSVLKVSDRPVSGSAVAILPAPATGLIALDVPVKEQSIEIRDAETGKLVTAIEILSPVNKRRGHDAFEEYRRKRRDLFRTSVHLMEIDLLRKGERPAFVTPLPAGSYYVFLSRAERRPRVEIWPLTLRASIPVVPVPLAVPEPDAPLDLGLAIRRIYEAASYDLRIDYHRPPPPPELAPEDAAWLRERLES
jgi:hypothetical protein